MAEKKFDFFGMKPTRALVKFWVLAGAEPEAILKHASDNFKMDRQLIEGWIIAADKDYAEQQRQEALKKAQSELDPDTVKSILKAHDRYVTAQKAYENAVAALAKSLPEGMVAEIENGHVVLRYKDAAKTVSKKKRGVTRLVRDWSTGVWKKNDVTWHGVSLIDAILSKEGQTYTITLNRNGETFSGTGGSPAAAYRRAWQALYGIDPKLTGKELLDAMKAKGYSDPAVADRFGVPLQKA